MAEKRWKKRHSKRIALRYGTTVADKVGFTDDVTREGLFIRSGLVAPPGARLLVELSPAEGKIVLVGEVRWTKKVPATVLHKMRGGMGLKILAFSEGESVYRSICERLMERGS